MRTLATFLEPFVDWNAFQRVVIYDLPSINSEIDDLEKYELSYKGTIASLPFCYCSKVVHLALIEDNELVMYVY